MKLVQEALDVEMQQNSIRNMIRPRKVNENVVMPRLLLVCIDTPNCKYDVLKKTKKLKGKEEYKNIILIRAQRENMKGLVYKAEKEGN